MQEGEKAGPDRATTRSMGRPTLFRSAPQTASSDAIPICPYLVREGPDQALGPAMSAVDPAHRCVALGSPVPQSARQQELVCLTAAHISCPRYLRGLQLGGDSPVPPKREPVSTAVIVATLILVASIAASFAFLAVRGGFDLGLPTPAPSQVAAASLPPTPGPGGSPVPSVAPTAGESVSPSIEPSPSAAPTPSRTPSVTPRPTSSPTPSPRPSSNRFALLTPCPSTDNCWIYVIRSGDNLVSITNYFGVDYNRVRKMNPRLRIPIHAGDQLRMPTPTR